MNKNLTKWQQQQQLLLYILLTKFLQNYATYE